MCLVNICSVRRTPANDLGKMASAPFITKSNSIIPIDIQIFILIKR